jgi:hypothetical protein
MIDIDKPDHIGSCFLPDHLRDEIKGILVGWKIKNVGI